MTGQLPQGNVFIGFRQVWEKLYYLSVYVQPVFLSELC